VTYTALVVGFLISCVALGAWGGERVTRPGVAVALAAAMAAAQLTVLLSR